MIDFLLTIRLDPYHENAGYFGLVLSSLAVVSAHSFIETVSISFGVASS